MYEVGTGGRVSTHGPLARGGEGVSCLRPHPQEVSRSALTARRARCRPARPTEIIIGVTPHRCREPCVISSNNCITKVDFSVQEGRPLPCLAFSAIMLPSGTDFTLS